MPNTTLAELGACDDIGKVKDQTHGLESGTTMPRICKKKYVMHGLKSGTTLTMIGKIKCRIYELEYGPTMPRSDKSTQGRDQLLCNGYTAIPKSAIPRARKSRLQSQARSG